MWLTLVGTYHQMVDYLRRRAKDIAYREEGMEPALSEFKKRALDSNYQGEYWGIGLTARPDFIASQQAETARMQALYASLEYKPPVLSNETLDMLNLGVDTPLNLPLRHPMATTVNPSDVQQYAAANPAGASAVTEFFNWLHVEEQKTVEAIRHLVNKGHTVLKDGAVVAAPPTA